MARTNSDWDKYFPQQTWIEGLGETILLKDLLSQEEEDLAKKGRKRKQDSSLQGRTTTLSESYENYADNSKMFFVDKILKCRTKKEYLVKWKGYSSKHNSWISEVDVTPDLKDSFHQQEVFVKKERKKEQDSSLKARTKKLRRIYEGDPNMFKVDKVLDCRTKYNRKKEYLIKWEGYSSKHNSWIPEVDVTPDLQDSFHQQEKLVTKESNRKRAIQKSRKKINTEIMGSEVEKPEKSIKGSAFNPKRRQKRQLKSESQSAAEAPNKSDTEKSTQVDSMVNVSVSTFKRQPSRDDQNEDVHTLLTVESSSWKDTEDEDKNLRGYDKYMKPHFV